MAHAEGLPTLDLAVEVSDLIDGITGFLQAPASQQTLNALNEAGPPDVASTRYLLVLLADDQALWRRYRGEPHLAGPARARAEVLNLRPAGSST